MDSKKIKPRRQVTVKIEQPLFDIVEEEALRKGITISNLYEIMAKYYFKIPLPLTPTKRGRKT